MTVNRIRRFARVLLPAMFLIVSLSACSRVEIGVAVADDGLATLAVILAFDADAVPAPERDALLAEMSAALDIDSMPDGARLEPYSEDGFVGWRASYPALPAEALAAVLSDPRSETGFASFALSETDGEWSFMADFVGAGDAVVAEGTDVVLAAEQVLTFTLALPGTIATHNADEVRGSTLLWRLGVADAETRQLIATSASEAPEGVVMVAPAAVDEMPKRPSSGYGVAVPEAAEAASPLMIALLLASMVVLTTGARHLISAVEAERR